MSDIQESTRWRLAARASHTAHEQATDRAMWFGPTGTKMHGAAVANHLQRATAVLTRDGWDPSYPAGFGILEALAGGPDLCRVAGRCVDLVLASISGAPQADYSLWETMPGRTFDEVCDLLEVATMFAREYGPEEVAA